MSSSVIHPCEYCVDARGSSLPSSEHWSDADQLGTRAELLANAPTQGLMLSHLVEEDGGLYHCRVDFKSSPTRNLRIRLDIIVPPRHLLITSAGEGGRVVSGVIGPYVVGTRLQLRCQVTGGIPTPTVSWWQGGTLLDDVSELSTPEVTRNSLRMPPLSRSDLLLQLSCVAFNSNLTNPISASVTIDIAFAPISVRLQLSDDEHYGRLDGREEEIWPGSWREDFRKSSGNSSKDSNTFEYKMSSSVNLQNLSSGKVAPQHPSLVRSDGTGSKNGVSLENEVFRSSGRLWNSQKFDADDRLVYINRQPPTEGHESQEASGGLVRSESFRNLTEVDTTKPEFRSKLHDDGDIVTSNPKPPRQDPSREWFLDTQKVETITLREGHRANIHCESSGSRPPAQYKWMRDGQELNESSYKTSIVEPPDLSTGKFLFNPSSYSLSALSLEPRYEDHGSMLSCWAFSPTLPNETVRQDAVLNVLYAPRVTLAVAKDVASLDEVEEGDDLHFQCRVDANPPVDKVYWTRDEEGIYHSPAQGVVVAGHGLEVLSVTRHNAGRYACFARNSEGGAASDRIQVLVKYAPVCSAEQPAQVGAGRREAINVTCSVASHPAPMSFRWAFNRSSEMVDIPQSSYWTSSGQSSTLGYQVLTEMDYGSLLCWAINDVGIMKTPCVIKLVPAAKPEAVKNCVIKNASKSGLQDIFSCEPGWDGGMNQTFTLEVLVSRNVYSRSLALVRHSPTPSFDLMGLAPDNDYLLVITATNGKGSSPPLTLTYRSPKASKVPSSTPDVYSSTQKLAISWTIFLAMLTGLLLTLLSCLAALLYVVKIKNGQARSSRRASQAPTKPVPPPTSPTVIIRNEVISNKAIAQHQPLQTPARSAPDTELWRRGCRPPELSGYAPANGSVVASRNVTAFRSSSFAQSQALPRRPEAASGDCKESSDAPHDAGCSSSSSSRPSSASLTIFNFGGRSSCSPVPASGASLNLKRFLVSSPTAYSCSRSPTPIREDGVKNSAVIFSGISAAASKLKGTEDSDAETSPSIIIDHKHCAEKFCERVHTNTEKERDVDDGQAELCISHNVGRYPVFMSDNRASTAVVYNVFCVGAASSASL
ncbi:nephrin-like [Hyalella azteca]|uniref:Nephrin-like n=1 Tax=Hyalella azteca TaxID=294128 RepID=A0A979FPI5_HYAAZ|nr:nephrin-like [Hyalella azteca]